jgi:uncharacterized membrane protein
MASLRLLRGAAIAAVVLGTGLRFASLERRVFWVDEAGTAQRVSGYWLADLERELFDGRVHTMVELHRFQHLASDRGARSIVEGLAREEAPWPPLYFVALRSWAGLFGDSVPGLRLFSVFASLLTFPACFWLCRELFPGTSPRDRAVPWVATALLAASPFHVVYAQEARAYALWSVVLLAASAMFLRACRTERLADSLLYGVLVALGLYIFPLTVFVVAAHGMYALLRDGFRPTRRLAVLAAGWGLGMVLYGPWILAIARNFRVGSDSVSWTATTIIPIPFLAYSWIANVVRVFFDLPSMVLWLEPWLGFRLLDLACVPIAAAIAAFVGLAVVRFSTAAFPSPARPRAFLLPLALIPFAALAVPDLLLGGIRSYSPRHQTAGLLALELIVATTIAAGLWDPSPRRRRLFRSALVALLVMGFLSGVVFACSRSWWNKYISSDNDRVAAMLNGQDRPLVVGFYGGDGYSRNPPFYFLYLLSMSHVLRDDVAFQVFAEGDALPEWDGGFSSIFLVNPTHAMCDRAEAAGLAPRMVYGFGAPRIVGDYYFTIWDVRYPVTTSRVGRWATGASPSTTTLTVPRDETIPRKCASSRPGDASSSWSAPPTSRGSPPTSSAASSSTSAPTACASSSMSSATRPWPTSPAGSRSTSGS